MVVYFKRCGLMQLERISQPEYLLYRISQSQHQIAISKASYCIKLLFVTGARHVLILTCLRSGLQ